MGAMADRIQFQTIMSSPRLGCHFRTDTRPIGCLSEVLRPRILDDDLTGVRDRNADLHKGQRAFT